MITYHIVVKTADMYLAGTDNTIWMSIKGDMGQTSKIKIKGDKERDTKTGWTVEREDVGIIQSININVVGTLADHWNCEYIKITKKSDRLKKDSPDGYYEFSINRKLSYKRTTFKPTYQKDPIDLVTAISDRVVKRDYLTTVNFANNPHPTESQDVMKYKETWQQVDSVSISKSEEESIGIDVEASYTPPSETGGLGFELSASWQSTISTLETTANEKMKASEFDWTYKAPANSAMFRKMIFEVPYAYQVYGDKKNSRIVRSLDSEIVPAGFEDFLFIPNMEGGKIVAVSWKEIESEWLAYADERVKDDVCKKYKAKWEKNGWVTP